MSINRNVIANFAGRTWAALIGIAFVPFYIRLMGIESYGIVGIFVSLQAMLGMLDLGLSQTMSREMARLSVDRRNLALMADTIRTIEIIYGCASVVVALIVLGLAGFISGEWLRPVQLSRDELRQALWMMALVIGLRWPVTLYAGALIGLQRQVLLNGVLAGFATVQAGGTLAALWLIEPTVQVFFMCQGAMALVQVAVLRTVLNRCIAFPHTAKFRKDIVIGLWRFAAGMTGISVLSILLTQVDKILLSKLLTLADFGYYIFATTVAGALYALTSAVFAAYQPRLTALATEADPSRLARLYHRGCQTMAVAIVPAGAVLACFSSEIVTVWTRDPRMVENSSLLISLLVIGNVLHGLMHLPYALQLAFGWTRLALVTNVISVTFLVPVIYLATTRWGAIGAASAWIALNIGYLAISVHYMHRRLLVDEERRWYFNDFLRPIAAVVAVVGGGRLLITTNLATPWTEIAVAAVAVAALAVAILTTESLHWRGLVPRSLER